MRYTALPKLEDAFLKTESNEYQFRKIAVPVKGELLTLEGMLCIPVDRSGYYHAVEHSKKRIVLHFTAGHIRSDLSALTRQDYHVSVAFVIGRNGAIYQLFSSKYWSGHIGKGIGNINTGNEQDKVTIGIELSNYGFLTERNGNLETYYSRLKDKNGNTAPVDIYCSLDELQAYVKTNMPFRGQSYYASYTDAQYNSLIILLRYLTAQYDIPREFLPEAKRFHATEDVLNFNGIVSHINYRVDGKWDIGPAFNWAKVISGVQAPAYESAMPFVRELANTGEVITSEEEIIPLLPAARDTASENDPYVELERSLDETGELRISEIKRGKKKLFALVVGINTYKGDIVLEDRVTFPPLRGCLEDAKKIQSYLQLDASFHTHIELLSDNRATKAEIVRLFKEHLGQAQEGDIALFYFSGHGTQQWADKSIWKSDTDGKLECIACYYDEQTKEDFLLADKELRYLIHELSLQKPHIVTIFDCCHSADNTRNGAFATTAFAETIEKRIPFVFKKREWSQFIFSDAISENQAQKEGEYQVLPEGQHVQLSACESDESAVEVAGEGVFTKTLLQVLKTAGGDITYYALRNRVRQYLRNVYEQKPRLYIANGSDTLLYTNFLNRSYGDSQNVFGEISYNAEVGWQLNLGAIHGIGCKIKEIKVIDPEDTTKSIRATVGLIGTDYTRLVPYDRLETGKVYQGYIEGLLSQNLRVHIKNIDGFPEDQQLLMQSLSETSKGYIVTEDLEENAQFVVRVRRGRYYITLPDDAFRPLAIPVSTEDDNAPQIVAQQLVHISKWQYIKSFTNQDSNLTLSSSALQIEMFLVDANNVSRPLIVSQDKVDIAYEYRGGLWRNAIRVKLTNTTTVNLYCCALYLSSDFGASLQFLNPNVYLLEPGNSVELQMRGSSTIPVTLDEVARWYNWAQQTEHLKFIVSTEEFDAQALVLEALTRPLVPKTKTRGINKKGLGTNEKMEEDVNGWTTWQVAIVMHNPEFNRIRESDLTLMLNEPELTDFALGLYFDAFVDEHMQAAYQLKPIIQLISEGGQYQDKGILQDKILDVANWWARRQRNHHYRDVLRRFPDRVRIVSEGDSWFQHPLVLDIIDHLSRVYAVYCVAAAGDTLRNYLSNKKQNGEYFMDALDEQQPTIFMISGGGNDILGAQFRQYLSEAVENSQPEGENPRRFLKNSLFSELDALMDIYRSLFGLLKAQKPNLHIIVHGYDYPVKLNDAHKGWLGRYMIEKGINREGDRRAIIHLVMDTFNDKLGAIAQEFDNVSYIDVRHTVRFDTLEGVDQWYDEIHPNNEGFQQIAMKFMQKINELSVEKIKALKPLSQHREIPIPIPITNTGIREVQGASPLRKTSFINIDKKADVNIDNEVDVKDVAGITKFITSEGQLEYDIPGNMQVGNTYSCRVNIADKTIAEALLKIGEKSVKTDVRISDEMSVKLLDASGGRNFKILEINSTRQAILTGEITTWVFKVSPIMAGRNTLLLKVTIHLDNRDKDVNVLEKEVLVSSNGDGSPVSSLDVPKRILFLSANPVETNRIRIDLEARKIKEELRMGSRRDGILFTMDTATTPVTMTRSLLREKPFIVHFSGHGSEDGLCLEDEKGNLKMISETALGALFSTFTKSIECVVLNACYSKDQADTIVRYISFVVGMQQAINDEAAVAFSVGFYQAIGEGEDIETAFKIGLASMEMEVGGQGEIPVLLQRYS